MQLPPTDWVSHYHRTLRKYLASFPRLAEFPILQAVHQLEGVCGRIVLAARNSTTADEQSNALLCDLYDHTLRGLTISVASHTWFGVGLLPGEEQQKLRKKAVRLLERLRHKGPVAKTDLLKNLLRNKRDRDAVVAALVETGLIRETDSAFTAVTYKEFLTTLYASDEFPAVESRWEEASGNSSETTSKPG